jgi:GNAT superfamily N-acetyltransferase
MTLRLATDGDAAEVGAIMAAGFFEDPVMQWVFSEADRGVKLATMFDFLAREAQVPLGATYVSDGACAAWAPPGAPDWPDERTTRFLEEMQAVCRPDDFERLGVFDQLMRDHHPAEPHWYLGVLATRPERQGQGLGTELLHASLARVDEQGLPAYLESSNPRNVSLYLRHGFVATGEIQLPDGPLLTTMWRDPVGPLG